jgi:predicted alpha/beta hydrolase family esterase
MKKLLILPGNSPRNQAWGEAAAEFFSGQFDEIYLQLYNHWETGEKVIDVPDELDKILATVENDGPDDEWYVCAKSVGSLVALIAVQEEIIQPIKCIFFGMPLDTAAEELFKDDWSALTDFAVPTLVFHNDNDPVANFAFTKNEVESLGEEFIFKALTGDTHDYLDFANYEADIKEFWPWQ